MRPCCNPIAQECFNVTPAEEWLCAQVGGTLGPEGAGCFTEGGFPDCWKCAWDVEWCGPVENCCLDRLNFAYVPDVCRAQCLSCGGYPVPTEEDCHPVGGPVRPCCFDGTDCQNMTEPEQFAFCISRGGKLGPLGTCCADPTQVPFFCPIQGVNPCWLCEHDLDIPSLDVGPCCFKELGFQWIANVNRGQCFLDCGGGQFEVEEEDCREPPRVPECIEAGEDREYYPGAPRWTLDTTGTVVFGLAKVTEEWTQFRENLGLPWVQVQGYTYAISTHLTRPLEPDQPVNACGHAVGGLAMLDDGYCYMATCSQPDVNHPESSHRRSFGLLRTFDESDPQIGVEAGYQYWVTCIRLPAWTEALYRSHKARCSEDPV